MILAQRIKLPNAVTVQCSHEADPREHRRAAKLANEKQSFHRRLPFRSLVLGFEQLRDVERGIPQRDELATAGQWDRIIARSFPAPINCYATA